MNGKVVYAAEKIFKEWEGAKRNLRDRETELMNAKSRLEKAVQKMGDFLVPEGARIGETFNIWYGSELICVTLDNKTHQNVYRIVVKKQGEFRERIIREEAAKKEAERGQQVGFD